ncbi:MAG: primosomal protein N' [Tannerella sp.]|jgi:primosomal protein N' (replication factor Y)|nr:primosomal protein N' [Tannerella sp.]
MKYAEVILPLPLANTYTYSIPEAMVHLIGIYCRVVVPFGKKHYYTGVVTEIHDESPEQGYEVKEIFVLLDEKPVIKKTQLSFWQWISFYYLCSLGEVCRAALPAGLKIESETVVSVNSEYEADKPLKNNEQRILDVLSLSSGLSVSELEKNTGLRNVFPVINALLSTGAVEISETLKRGFKPKTETYVNLADNIRTEADLHNTLTLLKRAKQQEKLFFNYLEISGIVTLFNREEDSDAGNGPDVSLGSGEYSDKNYRLNEVKAKAISKKKLLERSGINTPVLNGLIQRGILVAEEKTVSRIESADVDVQNAVILTEAQQKTTKEIKKSFETKDITLLHGVTSSGKTEIYIELIHEILSKGMQVLYLLPEIAISTQITERLRKIFGKKLLVYNSGISDNEKVEIWNCLLRSDEPMVVLGIRSSVFLPFSRLGLVIVDEEQESSYKQQDPAPRYHARNAAMMLAFQHRAKTLLGSATPSLESYLWAKNGKYGFVTLDSRYGGSLLPKVELVNTRELRRKKRMKDTLFSPLLKESIDEALFRNEQVILFQNRRGFAPFIICQNCGEIPHCVNCDVSLTYHKQIHRLVCHYCNYSISLPPRCPSCGSAELKMQGFGTEKIEEEVALLFPSVKAARLDMDTARTRSAYRRILSDFEEGKTQILIGTQMVSKGLDFANVSVVGVLNADGMMNIPDFRAYERAFQLMLQVSGRAGRREKQGLVVIQTSQSDNPLLQMVQRFDYEGMAQTQLKERYDFHYPPYTRLILIVLRSKNEEVLDKIAEAYSGKLKARLGDSVSGPVYPPVTRVQTLFVRRIMLKMDISLSVPDTRRVLEEVRAEMQQIPLFRQIILHYDVDPQ